ncbi:MAG: hypothetical protein [Caudoviricetes sp.]|nr:MAG: hypothetical protein [Caudoviricetes sp.]
MKQEAKENKDCEPIRAVVRKSPKGDSFSMIVSANTEFYGNISMSMQTDRCTEEFFENGQRMIEFVKKQRFEHPDREFMYGE